MKAEFLDMLDYWEREKNIPRSILIEALKKSFTTASKRAQKWGRELEVVINEKERDLYFYAKVIVVQRVTNPRDEISLDEAKKINPNVQIGDEIRIEVTPHDLGRIASTIATDTFKRLVRLAEKEKIVNEYKPRVGSILIGRVVGFEQSDVILELEDCEAVIPQSERVRSENFQKGDRVRALLKHVESRQNGAYIVLSRSDSDFVKALFEIEVSEIKEGIIEIKAIAREPGQRTKVAVFSTNPRVDPVGACVGLSGSRVKNIVRELNNEKVDIIRWDPDIRVFLANALAPAKVKEISYDEETGEATVVVPRDQYQLAIGKGGQNVRLTCKLCNCKIRIEPEAEQTQAVDFEEEIKRAIDELASIRGITEDVARNLVNSGVTSLESLLAMDEDDLRSIEGIGDKAKEILDAARAEVEQRKITFS
ncbi:MAG: transcription termination factor NusA [Verrucomicrobiae bacterium]|nr:transcription termination factor NusA [Verrucomicrobiae bacterium]